MQVVVIVLCFVIAVGSLTFWHRWERRENRHSRELRDQSTRAIDQANDFEHLRALFTSENGIELVKRPQRIDEGYSLNVKSAGYSGPALYNPETHTITVRTYSEGKTLIAKTQGTLAIPYSGLALRDFFISNKFPSAAPSVDSTASDLEEARGRVPMASG